MAKLPVIGITCDIEPAEGGRGPRMRQNGDYSQRVAEAGGLPVALPLTGDVDALADMLDGWLIPGGNDIDPSEYGVRMTESEMQSRKVKLVERARYDFERRLYTAIRRRAKPILGICFGSQFINVAQGGSLVAHIPETYDDPIEHVWQGSADASRHEVNIVPGTKLAKILNGERFEIVTSHHQSVDRLGDGLRVAAKADDGVIEAIESTDGTYLIGVQWHPERQPSETHTQRLFAALVAAAEEGRHATQRVHAD